ncbi:MAG: precorrin-4 C(11)-methyltransferase [Desulfobacterales bacterium]|nr:precorrin-4 C(11)-methyltransferase [Desulfobacterales bacterium]
MIDVHSVLFIGAGPGDPELITVKGMNALCNADLIIYTGSLVPEAVLKWAKPNTRCINSASLNLEEVIKIIEEAYKKGENIVRLHTGDPSIYGAIFEQISELKKRDIPYKVIPGVTAAFAASASLGIEYTLPEITQTFIITRIAGRTPVPELEKLDSLAQHKASIVIYLSISFIADIAKILQKHYGSDAPCAVAFKVSQPEEKIIKTNLSEISNIVKKENITNQALIIISRVLEIEPDMLYHKSKLYDKDFKHGFRK